MKVDRSRLCECRTAAAAACLWAAALTLSFAQAPDPAAAPDAPSPGQHPAQRAAERAEAERFLRNRADALAAAFLAEPHDAAWAAGAGDIVRRVLGDKKVRPPLGRASVECRSRTCRIEIEKPEGVELSERLPRLALRLAGDFPSMAVAPGELPSGQAVTRVYLSR